MKSLNLLAGLGCIAALLSLPMSALAADAAAAKPAKKVSAPKTDRKSVV